MHQKPSGYSEGVPQLIPTFLSLWVRNTIFNTNTHNTCGTYSFGTRTNVNYSPLKHSYMEHSCWEHSHICGTQPCGRLVLFWISYSCWSECNLWYQVPNILLYLIEEMFMKLLWNIFKGKRARVSQKLPQIREIRRSLIWCWAVIGYKSKLTRVLWCYQENTK